MLEPRIAPRYLGGVIDDGHNALVGVAGYPYAMRAGARHLLDGVCWPVFARQPRRRRPSPRCAILPAARAAARILFGDGSFPDVR